LFYGGFGHGLDIPLYLMVIYTFYAYDNKQLYNVSQCQAANSGDAQK